MSPRGFALERGFEEAMFLDPPEWFDGGILGFYACVVTDKRKRIAYSRREVVVYSRTSLLESMMRHMSYEDAMDWLCVNTDRSLPYFSKARRPVILDDLDPDAAPVLPRLRKLKGFVEFAP